MAAPDLAALIRQGAARRGVDPRAVLAVAGQEGLGGGIGDAGTSFGPFQLHYGGAYPSFAPQGASASQAWATSPAGVNYALDRIASVAKGLTGRAAVEAIVRRFERPANPSGEAARAWAAYGGTPDSTPVTTTPTALPAGGMPGALPGKIPGLDQPGFQLPSLKILSGGSQGLVSALLRSSDRALAMPTMKIVASSDKGTLGVMPTEQGTMPVAIEGKTTPQALGAIKLAQHYLGTPYVWGGETPGGGFDCSGLLQYVWGQQGVQIPRVTYDQWDSGMAVDKSKLQPGDAVFFHMGSRGPEHVGMYLGGGQFIEAPHTGASIRISELAGRSDFVGARRFS
jgi:cell wall-associated NlpC family hydrolase